MLRKVVSKGVWFLMILSALGGISVVAKIFASEPKTTASYSAQQAVAEHIAEAYVTVDNERLKEKQAILSLYPDDIFQEQKEVTVTQKTLHVAALDPVIIGEGERIKIPVDVWVLATKITKSKEQEYVNRHLLVSVFFVKSERGFVVSGLPTIEPQIEMRAKMDDLLGQPVPDQEQSTIEAVLKAFFNDYYGSNDPLSLKNYLADGVNVQPLSGFYEFVGLKEVKAYFMGEDKYMISCNIMLRDPITNVLFEAQMRMGLIKNQDRFFINVLNYQ